VGGLVVDSRGRDHLLALGAQECHECLVDLRDFGHRAHQVVVVLVVLQEFCHVADALLLLGVLVQPLEEYFYDVFYDVLQVFLFLSTVGLAQN